MSLLGTMPDGFMHPGVFGVPIAADDEWAQWHNDVLDRFNATYGVTDGESKSPTVRRCRAARTLCRRHLDALVVIEPLPEPMLPDGSMADVLDADESPPVLDPCSSPLATNAPPSPMGAPGRPTWSVTFGDCGIGAN